jgi:hypothetical protein
MLGEADVFVVVNAVLHVADPVSWPGDGPLDEVMMRHRELPWHDHTQ